MDADTAVIIPARYGSTRFPGKVLATLCGKPLIQHVWERASRASCARVCAVATDDERVADVVRGFGGTAVLTGSEHSCGTDRVREAADLLGLARGCLVVNVQGDEPTVDPAQLDLLAGRMLADVRCQMGTLACPLADEADEADPNVVKVVVDSAGYALYFSRAPVPGRREADRGRLSALLKHIGIYAYRVGFLRGFSRMKPGRLEQAERLEQLRALEHGFRIAVAITDRDTIGVDTPGDLEKAARALCGDKGRIRR